MNNRLNSKNHDRDAVGMLYVYPVISRRAGGVSVGINLNPNNACNWHCAYCQVPDLQRGVAPDIDLSLLRAELKRLLSDIILGDFMRDRVPEECRTLCDVAISGNGEPTSCKQFDVVVQIIVEVMNAFGLDVPLRLITNASYVHKAHVQGGLALMAQHQGEAWVKVDSVTDAGIQRINGIALGVDRLRRQLDSVAAVCPVWIQTCMFNWQGEVPCESEVVAYIDFLKTLLRDGVPICGVLLYGLARPSLQEEAMYLSTLDHEWMQAMADRIRQAGLEVKLSV
ncbi:radical SAM protein [Mariprofundus sp. EBB-1]|uniref:radical SAM protein n=1 Tax=Mariprofundus sp. EBB-1 TaxID=2650971 RepID=UPI000EF247C3|nr:radical SAM protein [Mariprofundus sp. EBB-1]RLL54099.1 radical SAM protein [Mariprofundus sp. EBB-1]